MGCISLYTFVAEKQFDVNINKWNRDINTVFNHKTLFQPKPRFVVALLMNTSYRAGNWNN